MDKKQALKTGHHRVAPRLEGAVKNRGIKNVKKSPKE